MNFKKQFLTTLCCALVCSSALFAVNAEEAEGEHIPVGSREMSLVERIMHKEARMVQMKSEEEKPVGKRVAPKSASSYYTTHQGAFYHPYSVSYLGDTVELQDGSIWSVSSDDRWQTLDWMTGDVIVIVPNSSILSVYDYKLVNLNTGAKVRVNLSLGPIYNGVYTHWIVAIDYLNQKICLEDGSIWSMSMWDRSVTNNWLVNDTVIIGINDGWLSGMNPNMLINVNTNNFAIGSCVY